jgi:hypothetical protein
VVKVYRFVCGKVEQGHTQRKAQYNTGSNLQSKPRTLNKDGQLVPEVVLPCFLVFLPLYLGNVLPEEVPPLKDGRSREIVLQIRHGI